MLYTFAEDAICDKYKILGATVIKKWGTTDFYADKRGSGVIEICSFQTV